MLSVTYDQPITSGAMSADQWVARPAPFQRKASDAIFHIGGATIGPMGVTGTTPFGSNPFVDFINIPAGEVVNPTTGAAVGQVNFPLDVIP